MGTEVVGVRGWFWPVGARRRHYDGGNGRALCRCWARVNPFTGTAAPIEEIDDAAASSPDDCAGCRRRLDAGA